MFVFWRLLRNKARRGREKEIRWQAASSRSLGLSYNLGLTQPEGIQTLRNELTREDRLKQDLIRLCEYASVSD